MHLFVSLIWAGSFMLCSLLAICATPLAIVCAIASIIAACLLRAMEGSPAPAAMSDNLHYRTDYHHHYVDPVHHHHGNRPVA